MKLKQRMLLKPMILVVLLIMPWLGYAQDDIERQYLVLLVNEITALEAILHKAELNRDKDTRVKFQYGWLRTDLSKMKSGVLAHINAPRTHPRKVAPLQGDYRQ